MQKPCGLLFLCVLFVSIVVVAPVCALPIVAGGTGEIVPLYNDISHSEFGLMIAIEGVNHDEPFQGYFLNLDYRLGTPFDDNYMVFESISGGYEDEYVLDINGAAGFTFSNVFPEGGYWEDVEFQWISMVGSFMSVDTGEEWNFNVMASASPAPVPEPSTILLLACGIAGIAGFRRKRLTA